MSKQELNVESREALARKIWLAGLGAYAKGSQELNTLSERGRGFFDELLERGRKVESDTKERVKEASTQSKEAVAQQLNVKVQRMTGLDPHQINEIDAKLDQLTEIVDKLVEAREADDEPKPVEMKTPKPATSRAPRKTAVKKDA